MHATIELDQGMKGKKGKMAASMKKEQHVEKEKLTLDIVKELGGNEVRHIKSFGASLITSFYNIRRSVLSYDSPEKNVKLCRAFEKFD